MISEHGCCHVKIQPRPHGTLFWLNLFLLLAIGLGVSAARADAVRYLLKVGSSP